MTYLPYFTIIKEIVKFCRLITSLITKTAKSTSIETLILSKFNANQLKRHRKELWF